jgi:hypothetical protein
MQLQKYLVPLASAVGLVAAYQAYGWAGVAIAGGALVMWLLLHFTRMMTVLQRAAKRPVGFVDSAVMLNAKLRPGVTLLHMVAMTRSLGELLSAKAFDQFDAQGAELLAHGRIDPAVATGHLMPAFPGQCGQAAHESPANTQNMNVHGSILGALAGAK